VADEAIATETLANCAGEGPVGHTIAAGNAHENKEALHLFIAIRTFAAQLMLRLQWTTNRWRAAITSGSGMAHAFGT
jgi:hypothetical protein